MRNQRKMKPYSYLLWILCLLTIFSSCNKNSDNPSGSGTIFSSTFANQSDLDAWNQSADGLAVIDQNAVKLTAVTGCFDFETKNLISVEKGKTYELSLTGKVIPAEQGDPAYCAGNFLVYVVQGSTNLISESFGNFTDWTQKSYSFTTTTSASIQIRFLTGTTRGAWIDEIMLTEK